MNILAIETSCDETAASVTRDGKTVLSNVVLSQIDLHARYGGVVPEIASREHIKGITIVLEDALKEANMTAKDIDLVAVTEGPGLIGSLLSGINAAKAFAFAHDIPFIGVHHIAAHIYANQIVGEMRFPLVCLVVSGGHTELILMRGHNRFEKLGETLDDAVGEAYDKVARVLGLGYPGGPRIDRLAQTGHPIIPMPRIQTRTDLNFSYSGLKSHVINTLNRMKMKNETVHIADMCASFQNAAVAQLLDKSRKAFDATNAKMFMVAGGVAANSRLRAAITETFADTTVRMPPLSYCTDNAAMVGIAAYYRYRENLRGSAYDLNGRSRLPLTQAAKTETA